MPGHQAPDDHLRADKKHISTSFAERAGLPIRMDNRRFARFTTGVSKKLEAHVAFLSPYFFYHHVCNIHKMLRVTAAMEAKVADRV